MATPLVIVAPSEVVPQGPFGGPGGAPFYDGVGTVVQITITYSSQVVWSVQANYRQKTADVFNAATHGSKGLKVAEIKLDSSLWERLLRVKGTTAPAGGVATDVVTSLTFITTKTTYGPYGSEVGRPFQSSLQGKVVGFFGRSGTFIDSFGTFTEFSQSNTSLIPDGPWGGQIEQENDAFYDAPADKIQQIDVDYGGFRLINALNVTYDRGSHGFELVKHGGHNTGTKETIVFDEDEYLAHVTGTTDFLIEDDWMTVSSLRFITNKTVYGPFGIVSGDQFQTRPDSHILGFFGRSGGAIDQLGAFVGGPPSPLAVEVAHFGGNGGGAFYEGRGEISQIAVTYLKDRLVAKLQVTYLQGGEQFVGALHGTGGTGGGGTSGDVATIPLNPPDEYLVQVKGTHGSALGVRDLIVSIQFITNKKTYGPYGNPGSGTPFASPNAGQIVGLFGRAGFFLDQIGVICFPDV